MAPARVLATSEASDLVESLGDEEAQQKRWLAAYATHGTIKGACAETKISRDKVARWKKTDLAFQTNFELADVEYTEHLETILDQQVEKNPILLMFSLKKRNPAYRENFKMEHSGEVAIRVVRYDEAPNPPPAQVIDASVEQCPPA